MSKPAVYRRAGSKAELVATALRTTLEATNPHIPDSGNVADDLRVVLDNLVATLTTTDFGRAVVELIGPASREPHLTELIDEVLDQRRIVMRTIIARADAATSRGRDLESAIDMALGAVYFRYLVSRRPLDRDFVDAIVHTFVDEPRETTSL